MNLGGIASGSGGGGDDGPDEPQVAELALMIRDNSQIHAVIRAHRGKAFSMFQIDAPASKMIAMRKDALSTMESSMSSSCRLSSSSLPSILQDLLYKSEEEAMELIGIVDAHREESSRMCEGGAPASRITSLRTENLSAMKSSMAFAPSSQSELRDMLIRAEEEATQRSQRRGDPAHDSNNPTPTTGGGKNYAQCYDFGDDCSTIGFGGFDGGDIQDDLTASVVGNMNDDATEGFSTIPQFDKAPGNRSSEDDGESIDFIGDLDSTNVGDVVPEVDLPLPFDKDGGMQGLSGGPAAAFAPSPYYSDEAETREIMNILNQSEMKTPRPEEPAATISAEIHAAHRGEGTTIPAEITTPGGGTPGANRTPSIPGVILTERSASDGRSSRAEGEDRSVATDVEGSIATDAAIGVATKRATLSSLPPSAFQSALGPSRPVGEMEDDEDDCLAPLSPSKSPRMPSLSTGLSPLASPTTMPRMPVAPIEPLRSLQPFASDARGTSGMADRSGASRTDGSSRHGSSSHRSSFSSRDANDILSSIYGHSDPAAGASRPPSAISTEDVSTVSSFGEPAGKAKRTSEADGSSPLDLGRANQNDATSTAIVEAPSQYSAAILNLMDALSPFYGMAGQGPSLPPAVNEALGLGRLLAGEAAVACQDPPSSSTAAMGVSGEGADKIAPPSKSARLMSGEPPKEPLGEPLGEPPEEAEARDAPGAEDGPLLDLNFSTSEILSSIYGGGPDADSRNDVRSADCVPPILPPPKTPLEAATPPPPPFPPPSRSKDLFVPSDIAPPSKPKEPSASPDIAPPSKVKETSASPDVAPPSKSSKDPSLKLKDGSASKNSGRKKRRSRKKRPSVPPLARAEGTDAPQSTRRRSSELTGDSDVSKSASARRTSEVVGDSSASRSMYSAKESKVKAYPPPAKVRMDDKSDTTTNESFDAIISNPDALSSDEVRLKHGLKGIDYKNSTGTYHAKLFHKANIHRLGEYELACDAALAFDEAARLLKGSSKSSDLPLNFKNKKDYLSLRAFETRTRGVNVDLKTALGVMSLPIKELALKVKREKSEVTLGATPRPSPSASPNDTSNVAPSSTAGVPTEEDNANALPPMRYSTLDKNPSLSNGSGRGRNMRRSSNNDNSFQNANGGPMILYQKLSRPDPVAPMNLDQKLSRPDPASGILRRKPSRPSRHTSQGSSSSQVSWAPPPSPFHGSNNTKISKLSGSLSDYRYVGSQTTATTSAKDRSITDATKISKFSGSLSDHTYVGNGSTATASTKDRSGSGGTMVRSNDRSGGTTAPNSNSVCGGGGSPNSLSRLAYSSANKLSMVPFTDPHPMSASDASFEPSTIRSDDDEDGTVGPRVRLAWSNESQSAAMTGRSQISTTVADTYNERDGSKAIDERLWSSFAWILTFPITNWCIRRPTKAAKQAWREKVALFIIMLLCSVFFVGVLGFVPLLLCKEDIIFSEMEIWLQTGESWVIVHGVIYDVKDFIYKHPGGVDSIMAFMGQDASRLFPRAPPVTLPDKCLDVEKIKALNLTTYSPENNFTNPTCPSLSDMDFLLGVTCHTFAAGQNGTTKFLGQYERGVLSVTSAELNDKNRHWFSLYDRVYDVTDYIEAANKKRKWFNGEQETSLDHNEAAYLTPTLNKVIVRSLGTDATDLYESLFGSAEYIACLDKIFYAGLLDDDFDSFCYAINVMMYIMLIFVSTLMVVQFLASMIYICPRHRTYTDDDVISPVMVKVPCYCEGDNELRKTIKSVFNTSYPDENKLLVMVADGLITGDGEDMSTPDHLANLLGFDIDEFEDDTFEYDCIGVAHTKNRARVYHGILQKGFKFLKYVVVVKCGLPAELKTSSKPGNRGKRDSQLIMIGFFNRIHYGRELTELDCAIQRAMIDLNLQADMIRFLMAIDADTRVDTMAITHMVYTMNLKEKVIALCGETKVDNKASSWVTMIQVFEYYSSHHLKKAFEAAFGCVTCLPGCFTMYRIIADDGTPLLPGDGVMYEYSRNDIETLHEKNLYHLGEDRLLTTLLLQYYPDRSLTFIPEATCWTIVPHTFKILLSQRRRWINSTVHNMFELLRVKTLCGVGCVSMKVVVFIDLIATMILPASYCYAMFLFFLVFFDDLPVSTVLLVLYAVMMGCQVAVFILRSRWEYIWWFFIYFTLGLPVFYLILPLFSFWNMDDFSWGKTRAVTGLGNDATQEGEDEERDDDDGYTKFHKGYSSLNTDDTSVVPSIVQDDMRSTSVCSSISGHELHPSRKIL